MKSTVARLVERLDDGKLLNAGVIPWGSPIPSFGSLTNTRVATVGLNPSNREFVDADGAELDGPLRRFHTLRSLRLGKWSEAGDEHFQEIADSCAEYFQRNPYDSWFRKLDGILSEAGVSYYDSIVTTEKACHIDLIPYATSRKWTDLVASQRTQLLGDGAELLAMLIRESSIELLVLNGASVVNRFQDITGATLAAQVMPRWGLPRRFGCAVEGVSFSGTLETIAGVRLKRRIRVMGFNHNLQSSFGVTREVVAEIRGWIGQTWAAGRET